MLYTSRAPFATASPRGVLWRREDAYGSLDISREESVCVYPRGNFGDGHKVLPLPFAGEIAKLLAFLGLDK